MDFIEEIQANEALSRKEQMDNWIWSYSRLGCFTMCPYKFYMKYLYDERIEKQDKFYATYGSYMHKLIERFYLGELNKEDMVTEFLVGFTENVKGVGPNEEQRKRYIQKGINYLTNFQPFPYKMVAVEKQIIFDIGGYKFVGYIDYLGEEDGEYIIIDNKSRDLKPRSRRKHPTKNDELLDDMLKQLYLYAEGVKQVYGKYPVKLCFNCFKNGNFIEEEFNPEKLQEAKDYALAMIDIIKREEEFPPMREFFQCYYLCDVSHECVFDQMERDKRRGK